MTYMAQYCGTYMGTIPPHVEALVGLEVRASSRDGFSTHLGELRLVTDFTFVNTGAGLTTLGLSF